MGTTAAGAEQGPGAGSGAPGGTRRPTARLAVVVASVLALLLVAAGTWALLAGRGSDPDGPDAGPTLPGGGTSEPSTSGPTTDPTAEPSPTDSPEPSGTAPGDPGASPAPTAVPEQPDETAPPVELDEPADFGTDVVARLDSVEAIEAEALGPGEVAGPALRVTVTLENGTDEALSLASAAVILYAGQDALPRDPMTGSGSEWFAGTVAPGATATAVYVFAVPADQRDVVRIAVGYDADAPTVLFEGAAPPAG